MISEQNLQSHRQRWGEWRRGGPAEAIPSKSNCGVESIALQPLLSGVSARRARGQSGCCRQRRRLRGSYRPGPLCGTCTRRFV